MTLHAQFVVMVFVVIGFGLRLLEASQTWLNPDEAQYFWMSCQDTLFKTWRASHGTHHPPLFVFVLHCIGKVSQTELALRSVPIFAGSLFPWVVFRWLGRVWNTPAAVLAAAILALAPNLISISAQARGYSLALLLIAASLLFLERAIDEDSAWWMGASAAVLWLATFVEYFVAVFAATAAVYFLLRIVKQGVQRRTFVAWVASQFFILGAYVFHYLTHIRIKMENRTGDRHIAGWLRGAFPESDQNLSLFFARAVAKQFAYLASSRTLGAVLMLVCCAGLALMWKASNPRQRDRGRPIVLAFLFALGLTFVLSAVSVHPFGNTRHTLFFSIFISAAAAVAVERIVRSRAWIILPAIMLLAPVWMLVAVEDQNNIPKQRHSLKEMRAGIEYLHETAARGALLLPTWDSRRVVAYYLGPGSYWLHERARLRTIMRCAISY